MSEEGQEDEEITQEESRRPTCDDVDLANEALFYTSRLCNKLGVETTVSLNNLPRAAFDNIMDIADDLEGDGTLINVGPKGPLWMKRSAQFFNVYTREPPIKDEAEVHNCDAIPDETEQEDEIGEAPLVLPIDQQLRFEKERACPLCLKNIGLAGQTIENDGVNVHWKCADCGTTVIQVFGTSYTKWIPGSTDDEADASTHVVADQPSIPKRE